MSVQTRERECAYSSRNHACKKETANQGTGDSHQRASHHCGAPRRSVVRAQSAQMGAADVGFGNVVPALADPRLHARGAVPGRTGRHTRRRPRSLVSLLRAAKPGWCSPPMWTRRRNRTEGRWLSRAGSWYKSDNADSHQKKAPSGAFFSYLAAASLSLTRQPSAESSCCARGVTLPETSNQRSVPFRSVRRAKSSTGRIHGR